MAATVNTQELQSNLTLTHPLAISSVNEDPPDVEICEYFFESTDKNNTSLSDLQEIVNAWIERRQEVISHLKQLVADLNINHRRVQIASVVGSTTALVGSAISAIGFGLAFFTFGSSLTLTLGGAAIAGAGGITAAGAQLFDWSVGLKKAKIIQQQLNEDADLYNKMAQKLHDLAVIKELHSLDRDTTLDYAIKAGGRTLSVGQLFKYLTKSVVYNTDGSTLAKGVRGASGAMTTAASITTGLSPIISIGGFVFCMVTVPLDVYFIFKDAKQLHNKTPAEVSEKLLPVIDKLETELLEVTALSEYGDDLDVEEDEPDETVTLL
jgi:hypothetical protein